MQSNYEKLSETWREKFLQLDQNSFTGKLPGVRLEQDQILFSYFGKNYRINRQSGEITGDDGSVPDANLKLLFYNLFWYSKEGAKFKGRWVPFREEAAKKLSGIKLPQSDAGYQIPSFDCIPIRFLFWDGDNEFKAQANILFDYSVTDFIHVESTVSIASDGIKRLAKEAGLDISDSF